MAAPVCLRLIVPYSQCTCSGVRDMHKRPISGMHVTQQVCCGTNAYPQISNFRLTDWKISKHSTSISNSLTLIFAFDYTILVLVTSSGHSCEKNYRGARNPSTPGVHCSVPFLFGSPSPMTLKECLDECMEALDLFLNNHFSESLERLRPR